MDFLDFPMGDKFDVKGGEHVTQNQSQSSLAPNLPTTPSINQPATASKSNGLSENLVEVQLGSCQPIRKSGPSKHGGKSSLPGRSSSYSAHVSTAAPTTSAGSECSFAARNSGRHLRGSFWPDMHEATIEECGYAGHPTTKLLEPEIGPCWFGATFAIFTYSGNFYKTHPWRHGTGPTRGYRVSLRSTVNLASDTVLPVQALVTATGFESKPTIGRVSLSSRLQSCNPASQT